MSVWLRPRGLRTRLTLAATVGALIVLGALVAAFNVVLDSRLSADADNVLREQAAAQLRTLSTVDGRLSVPEAPDNAVRDTLTWIFAGSRPLEQPPGEAENTAAAHALLGGAPAFRTVASTNTRLHAVAIVAGSRPLGTLVVGTPLRPYDTSADTALIASLILGSITVLALAIASRWIIRSALAPVAEMTAQAAQWGEQDLTRRFYAGDAHDELTLLAATFDRLLGQLARSLEREQRFTAEISHELRTPLAKIVAHAELAAGRERTPEAYRQALESIRVAAEQLAEALDMLLVAARLDGAHSPTQVDAHAVAERVAESQSATAARRGVSIRVTGERSLMRVGAPPELIERTLSPIVENAVSHATERVEVAVTQADGALVFAVSDDGPGIDPDVRERIFQPGVSLSSSAEGRGSGAGLGLPLARRLAEAAGGRVQCTSVPAGASFRIRFPLE
jgi:two-component system OmpR family sensor kinase